MIAIVLAGAIGAALIIVGYQLGREQTIVDGRTVQQLRVDLEESERTRRQLEHQLADASLGEVMDTEAYETLRQTIKELHDRLADTEEEVRFYRQLMAPSEDDRGLRIERLVLAPGIAGREVEFRLMLTQVVDSHDWINGKVTIDLVGRVRGEQQVLSLTELASVDDYPLTFRFKYFQNLAGSMRVPDGFTPERVVVTAEKGSAGTQLERTFTWSLQES